MIDTPDTEAPEGRWQPIETAPKGHMQSRPGPRGRTMEVHVPEIILAPTSDGKVVMTYWVQKSERWCMFSKAAPPTHWMPLPAPPEATP